MLTSVSFLHLNSAFLRCNIKHFYYAINIYDFYHVHHYAYFSMNLIH